MHNIESKRMHNIESKQTIAQYELVTALVRVLPTTRLGLHPLVT